MRFAQPHLLISRFFVNDPAPFPHRKGVEIYIPLPPDKNGTEKDRVQVFLLYRFCPNIFNLHSKILFSSLFVFLIWPTDTLAPFCLQPNNLAVCCDASNDSLHQMCVFCRVDPAGQFAVRNDNKASIFIEEAYCTVEQW